MRRLCKNEQECGKEHDLWQCRWDGFSKSQLTHRLILNISVWLRQKHEKINCRIPQLLGGDGQYVHRFGLDGSPNCPVDDGTPENAELVIFYCRNSRWRGGAKRWEGAAESFLSPLSSRTVRNRVMKAKFAFDPMTAAEGIIPRFGTRNYAKM